MISSIKDVIARCMERMRAGSCATCDNRGVCPAGRWQQAFGPPGRAPFAERRGDGPRRLFEWLAGVLAQPSAASTRCFKGEVEAVIEPMLKAGAVSADRAARALGMSRQTLYRRLKAEGTTFEELLDAKRRQLAIRSNRPRRPSSRLSARADAPGGSKACCQRPAGHTPRLSQVAQDPARMRSMQRAITSLMPEIMPSSHASRVLVR